MATITRQQKLKLVRALRAAGLGLIALAGGGAKERAQHDATLRVLLPGETYRLARRGRN